MTYIDQVLRISTLWRDASQNDADAIFWLMPAITPGPALGLTTALVGLLEQGSDAEVVGIEMEWSYNLVPFAFPASGNLVYPHACLFFQTAGGEEAVLAIPAAKDEIYQADDLTVDETHPAIADIIAAMRDGVGGVAPVAVPSGADLTDYIIGYKQERY